MKNILVSGVSGIIGYGIIRSLKKSNIKMQLLGTTVYPDSAGMNFCDVFEQAIYTDDVDYINWLSGIIKKHNIHLIIPGIEADMYKWTDHISQIEECGAIIGLNNPELISLCVDKWNFYQVLKKHNSPYIIDTSLSSDFNILKDKFGLPFLLKPRCGHGSKGIVTIINEDTFQNYKSDIGPVLMVQPVIGIEEEEFTTSAFCDGKGGFYACMSLKRKLSKDGFTEKAEVVELDQIENTLNDLCSLFKPLGPTNFQFRMKDGLLKLLEINPRISSATSIRTAFGYNESLMAVEYFLDKKMPQQPTIKKGKAVRFIEDLIIYE